MEDDKANERTSCLLLSRLEDTIDAITKHRDQYKDNKPVYKQLEITLEELNRCYELIPKPESEYNLIVKQALTLIEAKYQEPFKEFLRTGEWSSELMEYLGSDKNAQQAADMVFEAQCKVLDQAFEGLRTCFNHPFVKLFNR